MCQGASEDPHGRHSTAVEFYQNAPTPNLIIVESAQRAANCSKAPGELAELCDPAPRWSVIGHYRDVALYRDLIKAGVSEYMVAPISLADIVGVITHIFVDPEADPIGRLDRLRRRQGGCRLLDDRPQCRVGRTSAFSARSRRG